MYVLGVATRIDAVLSCDRGHNLVTKTHTIFPGHLVTGILQPAKMAASEAARQIKSAAREKRKSERG